MDTLVENSAWTVLPMSNRGTKTVYLKKGSPVGKLMLVNSVTEAIRKPPGLVPRPSQILDEELIKLIDDSELTDSSEIEELTNLVRKIQPSIWCKR